MHRGGHARSPGPPSARFATCRTPAVVSRSRRMARCATRARARRAHVTTAHHDTPQPVRWAMHRGRPARARRSVRTLSSRMATASFDLERGVRPAAPPRGPPALPPEAGSTGTGVMTCRHVRRGVERARWSAPDTKRDPRDEPAPDLERLPLHPSADHRRSVWMRDPLGRELRVRPVLHLPRMPVRGLVRLRQQGVSYRAYVLPRPRATSDAEGPSSNGGITCPSGDTQPRCRNPSPKRRRSWSQRDFRRTQGAHVLDRRCGFRARAQTSVPHRPAGT